MSKKLIAVASAAALALSALVAAPASANSFTVGVIGTADASASASVKTTPATNAAPVNNALNHTEAVSATNTTVRFVVTTAVAGADVAVSSAGGVLVLDKLTDAEDKALKVGAGSTGVNGKSIAGAKTFTFYAYSTSTTAGTVSITSGGNTSLYYVRSLVGPVYNIASAEFPSSIATNSMAPVYVKLTDVFGNPIVGSATGDNTAVVTVDAAGTGTISGTFDDSTLASAGANKLQITAVGGTAVEFATTTTKGSGTTWVWNVAKAAWAAQVEVGAVSGNVAVRLDLVDNERTDAGFAAPRISAFSSLSGADLATQVKTLTAQLADSRSKAKSVTKKRYNTLARKWNAAFPSQKVKLKK
jgi:hypothetical protein